MTIKWDRESLLVILMTLAIAFAGFYYGYDYFVAPLKEEAEVMTQAVADRQTLLDTYEPTEANLLNYESQAKASEVFLTHGDKANEALIDLQQHANTHNVNVNSMTRVENRSAIADMPSEFVKNSYTIEVTSSAPVNFRHLIGELMNEERVWDIHSFSYTKTGEDNYSGNITVDLPYYSTQLLETIDE